MSTVLVCEALILWLLIHVAVVTRGLISHVGCGQTEKDALLKLKHDLIDHSNRLASWANDGNCCRWTGVVCDNVTAHVVELHLTNISLGGKINPSLLNLKNLRYLDLSNNDFNGTHIPKFIGLMKSLEVLNLSRAGFGGMIPFQLGNLSNLHYLDLSNYRSIEKEEDLSIYDYESYIDSLQWLSGLSSLEFLDLSYVNMNQAFDWLEVTNAIPSLVELHLSYCNLPFVPPPLSINLSSLSILDLSYNFWGESHEISEQRIPSWVSHVKTLVSLNLAYNMFQGPIPHDLQNLTSLRKLNLGLNHFNSSIPDWLYSLSNLEILDLGFNYLHGKVSSAIGNMTSLVILDLSSFNDKLEFEGGIPVSFRKLCNLRTLYLNYVKLNQDIAEFLGILSSGCVSNELESLWLDGCQLFGHLPNHLGQFKNLAHLSLWNNSISGQLPMSLEELVSLKSLAVSSNKLSGTLPDCFGGLKNLEEIYLGHNMISGSIPTSFRELKSLRTLSLYLNQFNGSTLPTYFQALRKLEYVDIFGNSFEGDVSEIHLANLTKLRYFRAGGNKLILRVNPNWIPPPQIYEIDLSSWNIGHRFPAWLRSLKYISYLGLSNCGISSSIPVWFWNLSSQFQYSNLSHNQIHGVIPDKGINLGIKYYSVIDLSSNNFRGPLPSTLSMVTALDLSNNSFSGSISNFLCHRIHEQKNLELLNLEENHLSGDIPDCWMSWQNLIALKLSNNKFSGNIPMSIGSLRWLESLHLRNNNLSGELPVSLENCTKLITLDVGGNELAGSIPSWMGERLSSLVILNMRANKFRGHIPQELCNLSALQILDLADNLLSGSIPTCILNFSAMAARNDSSGKIFVQSGWTYFDNAFLVMKGKLMEYNTILKLVRSIDLSNNSLGGEIPKEVTSLGGLLSLNLSQNSLVGRIPEDIGAMQFVESIDFSLNHLSGEIPQSMSSLTFLSHLNLSGNKLQGKIPLGTQLQSFGPYSFMGNQLCGSPLPNNCSAYSPMANIKNEREEDDGGIDMKWFYMSMPLGFVVGFWVVVDTLLFNKRWRYVYFHFLDKLIGR